MNDNGHNQRFTILLIEDSVVDAHLTRAAIEENKFDVALHHVLDGLAGLAYLRSNGNPRPDLILLDLNMPRMNGREFLAEMKADGALKDIPVVVLTTSDVEQDVAASYQMGASGFITKPVDLEQFVSAVNMLGNYWFKLVRIPQG